MKPSIITNQALINQSQPNGQESTNLQRRTVIGGALVALLASPGRVLAKEKTPKDPLVLLLNGPYQEVDGNQPDLGFSKVEVNLHDGTFLTTQIFPVTDSCSCGGACDSSMRRGPFAWSGRNR